MRAGRGRRAGARALLRRLSARDLVDADVLRQTTPGFQRIAEEERAAAHRRGSVAVEVRTEPEGARVLVNGVARCPVAPCRVHLLRGEHHLIADKLGYRRRVLTPVADADATVRVVLEPASADETRQQLTAALAAGADPSAAEIPRATASAFGAGLLVLVWARQWQVHAAAYHVGGGALTHVAFDGPQAMPRAVAAALHELARGDTGRGRAALVAGHVPRAAVLDRRRRDRTGRRRAGVRPTTLPRSAAWRRVAALTLLAATPPLTAARCWPGFRLRALAMTEPPRMGEPTQLHLERTQPIVRRLRVRLVEGPDRDRVVEHYGERRGRRDVARRTS